METKLFYFSGTGNCLSIAKELQTKLENTELISIPTMVNEPNIEGEVIGIIAPIYMHDMPHIVADFIRKIKKAEYIFFVYAGAGQLGKGIKRTIKRFDKQDLKLSALFNIAMPSNYTPYGCPSGEKQKELINNSIARLSEIADVIKNKKEYMDDSNTSFFKTHVHPGILYKMGYPRISMMDNSFNVDENCNECSICEQVCPVNNIKMKDKKPTWNNNCQQCYACLQWCPQKSIQYGKSTASIERYQHPNVKVKEIVKSAM